MRLVVTQALRKAGIYKGFRAFQYFMNLHGYTSAHWLKISSAFIVSHHIDWELFTRLPYPLDGEFFHDRDLGSCLSLCLQSLAWRLAWSRPIDFWEELKGFP